MIKDSVTTPLPAPMLSGSPLPGGSPATHPQQRDSATVKPSTDSNAPQQTPASGATDSIGTTQVQPPSLDKAVEELDADSMADLVERLNEFLEVEQRALRFSMDENSGRTIITVVERGTDEVIRQIPPEAVVALGEYLRDQGELRSSGLLTEQA